MNTGTDFDTSLQLSTNNEMLKAVVLKLTFIQRANGCSTIAVSKQLVITYT